MRYANLGRSGLKVSRLCLGTMSFGNAHWQPWVLNERNARPIIKKALELGINFFDTADVYSNGASEEILGRALRDFVARDEVVIATKVHGPMGTGPNHRGLSRKHVIDAVHASLHRLGTDYIDLYQIHRWDDETPLEETLSTLDSLVRSGKVRYIGASSMFAWQFAKALYVAELRGWTRFISMQNHYNIIYREEEREMLPLCQAEGIGVIPWSPMARGFVAGNRFREGGGSTVRARTDEYARRLYYRDSDFDLVERVLKIAGDRNISPCQLALAWILSRPGVTAPIIGVSSIQQLEEAVASLSVQLSEEECRELKEAYTPHPILGHP